MFIHKRILPPALSDPQTSLKDMIIKQELKNITISLLVIATPFCAYYGWKAYKFDKHIQEMERFEVIPITDKNTISEIGYIWDKKSEYNFSLDRKLIIWWIKIPATDVLYICHYQAGYLDFRKGDSVKLIHQKNDGENEDSNAYIMGLHLRIKDKLVQVTAVDAADIEYLIDGY